ncbi:kinase-like protein [Marasmius fiardii PR-910]|nr:kinase-like protein [Marasmius fiardii PR-910]
MSKYIRAHQFEFLSGGIGITTVDDIRALLSLEAAFDTLSCLEISRIPRVLDLLYMEIQTKDLDHQYRRKCGKYLRDLSKKHSILPPSWFVTDITNVSPQLVAVGGNSDVYQGIYQNRLVCLKVSRTYIGENKEQKNKILHEFYDEALIWIGLDHPNLLPFLGINITIFHERLCLVAPWMSNGPITKFLKQNSDCDKLRVISEIAAGISYLHSHNIVHGDIKGVGFI